MQNIDFTTFDRVVYTNVLGGIFNVVRNELIQEVHDNKDCHLLVLEKKRVTSKQ